MQADHYIIRLNETSFLPKEELIDGVLEANGYTRGTATIDFRFVNSIDDAYMAGLSLKHEDESGKKVDDTLSKMHNVSGAVKGKLIAIYYLPQKGDRDGSGSIPAQANLIAISPQEEQAKATLKTVSPQLSPEKIDEIVRAARLVAAKHDLYTLGQTWQLSHLMKFMWYPSLDQYTRIDKQLEAGIYYLHDEFNSEDSARNILRAFLQGDATLREEAAGMALFINSDYDNIIVPALINWIKDPYRDVRRRAFWSISQRTKSDYDKIIVLALIDALKNLDFTVRVDVIYTFIDFCHKRPDYDTIIIPALIDALKDHNFRVRTQAIRTLHSFDTDRIKAVPDAAKRLFRELKKLSDDNNEHKEVRQASSIALWHSELEKRWWQIWK